MRKVIKREFSSYFTSPIGYFYLAAITLLSGYTFYTSALRFHSISLTGVLNGMILILLFLLPLFASQQLQTKRYGETESQISSVVGSFLSAFFLHGIGMGIVVLYAIVSAFSGSVDAGLLINNLIGLLFLGAALISIGLFISSLVEKKVVSAIISIVVSVLIMLAEYGGGSITNRTFERIFHFISLGSHYESFTYGILDVANILFFLSISAIFLFLTIWLEERKQNRFHREDSE